MFVCSKRISIISLRRCLLQIRHVHAHAHIGESVRARELESTICVCRCVCAAGTAPFACVPFACVGVCVPPVPYVFANSPSVSVHM